MRPPVMGPSAIRGQLGRLAFVRVLLQSMILVVALANLALAVRTPFVMGTELFVADGSAVGCHVTSFPVAPADQTSVEGGT